MRAGGRDRDGGWAGEGGRRIAAPLLLLILLQSVAGCDGVTADPGLNLGLRVPGRQLVPGALRSGDGPAITAVEIRDPLVRPGQGRYPLSGRAAHGAAAIHVARAGDDAWWVVPTGLPDPASPDEVDFALRFDLAPDVPEGPMVVTLRAVDADGRPGPLREARFTVGPAEPEGALVISLSWDAAADVDLYVLDPQGHLLSHADPNTYTPPRPGEPPAAPDAWRGGGILDRDAGADCAPEGRLAEHAVWADPPPAGDYVVSVDLASPCGHDRVAWRLTARLDGAIVAQAAGVLYPDDARRTTASGATPLRAASFRVP